MHCLNNFFLLFFRHCNRNSSFWLLAFLLFLLVLFIRFKLVFELFMIDFFLLLFLLFQQIFLHLLLQLRIYHYLADSFFVISNFIRLSYRMHPRFPISIFTLKLGYCLFPSRKFLEQFSVLLVQLIEVWLPLTFKSFFLFYLVTYLLLQRMDVFRRMRKIGLASIRLPIFCYQMVLSDLSLDFSDLCCLLTVVVHQFSQPLQKLFLVVLVRQISLHSFVLVSLASSQYIPLVSQFGTHLFCYFQVILFMDNILHVILGPLQPKTFDSCPQLPHESFLHDQLLEKWLVWIFRELFFYRNISFETVNLSVYEVDLMSKTGVLLDESASILGVLVVSGAAQLHSFYLIYQHLLSK